MKLNKFIVKLEEMCNAQGYNLIEVNKSFVVIEDKYGERVQLQKEFFDVVMFDKLY